MIWFEICSLQSAALRSRKEEEGTLIDGPTMLGWSDRIFNHFYWPTLKSETDSKVTQCKTDDLNFVNIFTNPMEIWLFCRACGDLAIL